MKEQKDEQLKMLTEAIDEGWIFTKAQQIDGSWAIVGSPDVSPIPKNDADLNNVQDVVNEFLVWMMSFEGTSEELYTNF